jgi:hypothetical protein
MDKAIISPIDGTKVGYIRLAVHGNLESLKGRFGAFLTKIPFEWDYPLGVFEDLHVNENERRKGYGRLGLRMADDEFRKSGVATGILKVGWGSTENWEEAKAWKSKLYSTAGWIALPWTWPEPVLMVKNYRIELNETR